MSKIVVLTGSPRKGGNTETLAKAFAEGARTRHEVEILSVADLKVAPCIGCNTCFAREGNACFRHDDMDKVFAALATADILVIASPVYFYGVSSQLKAVIDRLHTPLRNTFHIRKACILLCGAASLPELFDAILKQYELALKFFDIEDLGHVLARGVKEKGDVQGTPALDEAKKLGETI